MGNKYNRKWAKELVLEKIREYNSQGISLKSGAMQKYDMSLFNGARRTFGNWKSAMEAAKIDYAGNEPNVITDVGSHKEITIFHRDKSKTVVLVDKDYSDTRRVCINSNSGYPAFSVSGELLHRFIYGEVSDGNYVDHINRCKLDCRRENLREVTPSQNSQNRYVKMVSDRGIGKYTTTMKIDGKRVCIGTFDTPEEARIAYLSKCLETRGEHNPVEYTTELEELKSIVNEEVTH